LTPGGAAPGGPAALTREAFITAFVLVHGAWHGGWCWQRVRARLAAAGHHAVYTPTLTGLADRSHLMSARVDLDTHIADIVNLIRWEGLTDIVLCGHSYGGSVVTGVADATPERLRALVYLDAFVPGDGDSATSLVEAPAGTGTQTPSPPAEWFGLSGPDADWANERLTAHPAAASDQPIRLRNGGPRPFPVSYVLATGWRSNQHFQANYERARSSPGWQASTMDGSHDLMIDRADAVTALLLKHAN
jgi:pimeloyl-ACP methyl ester carboxylesterase